MQPENDNSHSLSGTVLVYVLASLLLFHVVFLTRCELVLARTVMNLIHTVVSFVDPPLEMNLRTCVR